MPIAKLEVAELKAELEARELSKRGRKDGVGCKADQFHGGQLQFILFLNRTVKKCQLILGLVKSNCLAKIENVLSGQFTTQTTIDNTGSEKNIFHR